MSTPRLVPVSSIVPVFPTSFDETEWGEGMGRVEKLFLIHEVAGLNPLHIDDLDGADLIAGRCPIDGEVRFVFDVAGEEKNRMDVEVFHLADLFEKL